jgi:hypothetical protein
VEDIDEIEYERGSTTSKRRRRRRRSTWNEYALFPGELPGYTGWSRPEQTLAGYFDVMHLSHPPMSASSKYHSISTSGDVFSLLLTCNHDRTTTTQDDGDDRGSSATDPSSGYPPYECPQYGGTLFYVRAYGPSVISGIITDHGNSSYTLEMKFVDVGEYTLEVVVTFSLSMEYDEFPAAAAPSSTSIDDGSTASEPGYEGYMVSNFPLQILVVESPTASSSSSSTAMAIIEDDEEAAMRRTSQSWCTLSQLTETSPTSGLYAGHWRVIDKVGHSSHRPLTPDEASVSLDGYRMGLNSLGVRMGYVREGCELIRVHDLVNVMTGGGGGMDGCLGESLGINVARVGDIDVGSTDETDGDESDDVASNGIVDRSTRDIDGNVVFEGVHVIFIGDSVMRLVRFFFLKLIGGSRGFKVTFIETNGGIHATMHNITSTLADIRRSEESANVKSAVLFNSGLHDIDILCSSKRSQTRSKTNVMGEAVSCQDAYREGMTDLVRVLDEYPADLKVFRSTTAGKKQNGGKRELFRVSLEYFVCSQFNDNR